MFDYNDYLEKQLANNPDAAPSVLWDKTRDSLSVDEKAAAFDLIGGSYLTTYRLGWLKRFFSKPAANTDWSGSRPYNGSPVNTPLTPVQSDVESRKHTEVPSLSSSVAYNPYTELSIYRNTHNPNRRDKEVPRGEWTQEDWKCYSNYYEDTSNTYKAKARWGRNVQTAFMDNPDAKVTRDVWPEIVSKYGKEPGF